MRNRAENHQLECETISKDEIETQKKVKSWNLEDGSVWELLSLYSLKVLKNSTLLYVFTILIIHGRIQLWDRLF